MRVAPALAAEGSDHSHFTVRLQPVEHFPRGAGELARKASNRAADAFGADIVTFTGSEKLDSSSSMRTGNGCTSSTAARWFATRPATQDLARLLAARVWLHAGAMLDAA